MRNRIIILLFAMAISLTTTALAQSFSTGSDMMSTGSSLSSTVYGVGATSIDPMATTAAAPAGNRGRTIGGYGGNEEIGEGAEGSPIGAPYIMLLFAAGAAGVTALRRRKQA